MRRSTLAIAVLAVLPANSGHAEGYNVTVIAGPTCSVFGPLPLFFTGLNEYGAVAGWRWQCEEFSRNEGLTWTAEEGIQTIPRPPEVVSLSAGDINDLGDVVGTMSWLGTGGMAYLYRDSKVINLWTPDGGNFSQGAAINSRGDIVGRWGNNLTGIPTASHALLIVGGSLMDIGADLSLWRSLARDVNDSRQVVGSMWTSLMSTTSRAFLWDEGKGIDLGVLPRGVSSSASGINNAGVIVGSSRVPRPTKSGFDSHPVMWQGGTPIDLGILPGFSGGSANDINDQMQIVGHISPAQGPNHGFIWQDGIMRDLNDLIPPGSGVTVTSGISINEAGQIAAAGETDDGDLVGILLTPIPDVTPMGDLNRDLVVDGIDLGMLLANWSIPPTAPGCGGDPGGCTADLNADGFVNGIDLGILLANWTIQ